MRAGFFSDLDNTLIYSARHLRPGLPPVVGLEAYPNKTGGYMTVTAHKLLIEIAKTIPFVPVTARHFEQWHRLQFDGLLLSQAVLCNGAVIVRDGMRDADWDAHIKERQAGSATVALAELRAAVEPVLASYGLGYVTDVVEDLFCVYIMDGQELPALLMSDLEPLGRAFGYRMSLQHKKLHVVPLWLSKGEAVGVLAKELGLDYLFAAGDAVLDGSMLDIADQGWVPTGSEIAAVYAGVSHVVVTKMPGLLGGEQVLRDVAAAIGVG